MSTEWRVIVPGKEWFSKMRTVDMKVKNLREINWRGALTIAVYFGRLREETSAIGSVFEKSFQKWEIVNNLLTHLMLECERIELD